MAGICLYCQRALGCPLLSGKSGHFDADRLFTEKSTRLCDKFVEITGVRERDVRERMYKSFGVGYLRTLYELPELMMEGLRQGEKDELMYENVPNFQDPKLLWEGMTSIEREDVLRHQTDEDGRVIVEIDSEGVEHKMARPEYHIKAYLCDPNGPIRAEKSVAWMWNINQLVDHILKTEAELGLIVKVKKPSATQEPAAQPVESESDMPGPGRTVRTVRTANAPAAAPKPAAAPAAPAAPAARRVQPKPGGPPAAVRPPARAPAAPAPAAGGRVANPPARRVATPPGAPGRAAPKPAGAPAAAPPKVGGAAEGASMEQLEKAVFNVVNPMFEELVNLVKAAHQGSVDAVTVLGDMLGQTGGTLQIKKVDKEGNYVVREDGSPVMVTPQLYAHKSRIFAHIEGSSFNPEYLMTIREDNDPDWDAEASAEEQAEGEAEAGETEGEVEGEA